MANETVMAFDFGLGKIGVAVGQSVTGTATPVMIIRAKEGTPDWAVVERLIKEWGPGQLVVGLPLNMDGSESEMSERAARFGRRLAGRYNLPVTTMDERLTSREAAELAKPGEPVDAIAAQLILESWFRNR